MIKALPFYFAYEINNYLRLGKTEEEKLFTTEQYIELADALRNRALIESNGTPLFEKYPNCIGYLFSTWKEKDAKAFDKYINETLSQQPNKVMDLLLAYTPTARVSNYPEPFKSDFSKESYNHFITFFDKEQIHNLINEQYKEELSKEDVQFSEFRNIQTNINIIRQFEYWYNKDKEGTK